MKKVLILGAGLVSRPMVDYLLQQKDINVTVATRTVSKASELVKGHPNGKAVSLDVSNDAALEQMVSDADLVVSLLPYIHHVAVAKHCIKHKKHMVTTSYVSDAMRALDKDAQSAGIVILNEIGLDPGIDHMSAMRIINNVKNKGGKVTSFYSYCGGLPAPEANDNPLGYKFSWSPRGVVMAGKNNAQYLKDGSIIKIPSQDLFAHNWLVHIDGLGDFEAYPNRNSLGYVDLYGLQGIGSMFRGTLRNIGWCELWKGMVDLGFLNDDVKYDLKGLSYERLVKKAIGAKENEDARVALNNSLGRESSARTIIKIEWLGLLSYDPINMSEGSIMDVLVDRLLKHMQYKKGERDMIVLHHEFAAEYPKDKKEQITSTLIDFGVPNGDSSMSRTVSLPAAIASRLILENKINLKGVQIPVMPEIYNPVLDELEGLNIVCKEVLCQP